MPNPYISGTGFYLPPRIVTNDELSTYMDTSDEWIQERTGIKERHYVEKGEGPSDIAIPATKQALNAAGLKLAILILLFSQHLRRIFMPLVLVAFSRKKWGLMK